MLRRHGSRRMRTTRYPRRCRASSPRGSTRSRRTRRQLLQDAAVLGKVFWHGAVAALGGLGRGEVEELCTRSSARSSSGATAGPLSRARRSTPSATFSCATSPTPRSLAPRGAGEAPPRGRVDRVARPARGSCGAACPPLPAARSNSPAQRGRCRRTWAARRGPRYREAGDRALGLNAARAAVRFYRAALDLWPDDDEERPELLLVLGRAEDPVDDVSASKTLWEAHEGLLGLRRADRAAEADVVLADIRWRHGDADAARVHLESAAALVADTPPSPSKAFVLSQLSRFHMLASRFDEATRFGEEALAMAEDLGLEDVRADALNNLGSARERGVAGIPEVEESVEILERLGSVQVLRGYNNLTHMLVESGALGRASGLADRAVASAERFGYDEWLHWNTEKRTMLWYLAGRWDDVVRVADDQLAAVAAEGHYLETSWLALRSFVRLARGDADGALGDSERSLEMARPVADAQMLQPALVLRSYVLLSSVEADGGSVAPRGVTPDARRAQRLAQRLLVASGRGGGRARARRRLHGRLSPREPPTVGRCGKRARHRRPRAGRRDLRRHGRATAGGRRAPARGYGIVRRGSSRGGPGDARAGARVLALRRRHRLPRTYRRCLRSRRDHVPELRRREPRRAPGSASSAGRRSTRRPAREERKVVSVVFGDLVGSTARAEQLDPEDVRAQLAALPRAACARELERFGGTVEKFIGDAVVAVFGAPVAHEDDPERAVRAALAIRDWAARRRTALAGADRRQHRRGARLARRAAGGGGGRWSPATSSTRPRASSRRRRSTACSSARRRTARPTRVIEYRERASRSTAKGKARARCGLGGASQARSRFGVDVEQPAARRRSSGASARSTLLRGALAPGARGARAAARDARRRPRHRQEPARPGALRAPSSRAGHRSAGGRAARCRTARASATGRSARWSRPQAGILESDDAARPRKLKLAAVVGRSPGRGGGLGRARSSGRSSGSPTDVGCATSRGGGVRGLAALPRGARRRSARSCSSSRTCTGPTTGCSTSSTRSSTGPPTCRCSSSARRAPGAARAPAGLGRRQAERRRRSRSRRSPSARRPSWCTRSSSAGRAARRGPGGASSRAPAATRSTPRSSRRIVAERGLDAVTATAAFPRRCRGSSPRASTRSSRQEKAAAPGRGRASGRSSGPGALGAGDDAELDESLHALERKEFIRRERRSSVEGEPQYAFRHVLVRDVAYGADPAGGARRRSTSGVPPVDRVARSRGEDTAELLAHHYVERARVRAGGRASRRRALALARRPALRAGAGTRRCANAFRSATALLRRRARAAARGGS